MVAEISLRPWEAAPSSRTATSAALAVPGPAQGQGEVPPNTRDGPHIRGRLGASPSVAVAVADSEVGVLVGAAHLWMEEEVVAGVLGQIIVHLALGRMAARRTSPAATARSLSLMPSPSCQHPQYLHLK